MQGKFNPIILPYGQSDITVRMDTLRKDVDSKLLHKFFQKY